MSGGLSRLLELALRIGFDPRPCVAVRPGLNPKEAHAILRRRNVGDEGSAEVRAFGQFLSLAEDLLQTRITGRISRQPIPGLSVHVDRGGRPRGDVAGRLDRLPATQEQDDGAKSQYETASSVHDRCFEVGDVKCIERR